MRVKTHEEERETVGGDFAAPQSRVAVAPWSWAYGDVAGVAGGRPWSDPCSFCDRWCGHSGGFLGAQCRVPRAGDSGAGAAGFWETRVEEMEQEMQRVVAELGKKLEKRVRDVEKLSSCGVEAAGDFKTRR